MTKGGSVLLFVVTNIIQASLFKKSLKWFQYFVIFRPSMNST